MSQIIQGEIRKDELLKNVEDVVRDPYQWLHTPNDQLGGRTPMDMIDANDDERRQVHDLIEAVKHGMVT
jgi:uncharacterized protein (DUF2384 family)